MKRLAQRWSSQGLAPVARGFARSAFIGLCSLSLACSRGDANATDRKSREATLATSVVDSTTLPEATLLNAVLRLDSTRHSTSEQLSLYGVLDAAATLDGHIYILENNTGHIAIADTSLRLLGTIGQLGSSSGQFREPVGLAVLRRDRLAVLDRALHRVTVFGERVREASAKVERTIALKSGAESFCALNDDKLLIYGLLNGQRLHVYDMDGRLLRSFAPADTTLSSIAQSLVTQGRIACDQAHDEVLVTSTMSPTVESYRISTGEQHWRDRLRPFRALQLIDYRQSATIRSGRAGYSRITAAFFVGDYRVFQAIYDARRDGAVRDTVVTYSYSRPAARWLAPDLTLPRMFALRRNRVIFEVVHGSTHFIEAARLFDTTRKAP